MEDKFLSHYGVMGMKWGVRRAENAGAQYSSRLTKKFNKKAGIAKESAKEWDEMAKDAAKKGKTKQAEKYKSNAKTDRDDAKIYSQRAKRSQTVDDLRKNAVKETKIGQNFVSYMFTGANVATNKTLGQLRQMNSGNQRTKNEKKVSNLIDTFVVGRDQAERNEAYRYIYR